MSNIPNFTIKELLDAGVHFGHKTMRWNPKMASYIYGEKDGIHIIDLQQTAPLLHRALTVVYEVIKNNGRLLFVGTKKQASELIAEEAKRCGQYYVNHRWLGGMLTNWSTVSASIQRLDQVEKDLANEEYISTLKKKEVLELTRKRDKLERSFGGIRQMGGQPDMLFVIDTNKENIAIKEASRLGIPVIAIIDSNSDPDNIDYPIPGNDDASKSIKLYLRLIADAAIAGIRDGLIESGVDLGEVEDVTKMLENNNADKKSEQKPKGKKPTKATKSAKLEKEAAKVSKKDKSELM